ncbi:hypothetical protein RB601_008306 [Gaeumannomyces tritici]
MFALLLTAEMQGVTNLRPSDTEENPFWYTFKVQCTSCREVLANWVGVNRFETNEMSGSRGEANFVWKCKNCKVCEALNRKCEARYVNASGRQRESSASIKAAPTAYEASEPAKARKILEFDCRGLEFTEFQPEVCLYDLTRIQSSKPLTVCAWRTRVTGWLKEPSLEPSSPRLI